MTSTGARVEGRSIVRLIQDASAIREGRRFARAEVTALGADQLADDVELAAAELLANAVQHGLPPISITVTGTPERVRLEVSDGNSRPPVRPAPNVTNMTGRGIAMLDALATRWGVQPEPDGGKTIWADFVSSAAAEPAGVDADVDVLLQAWQDPEVDADAFTVVLGDVPTDLLIDAKAHIDNLVREFTLAASAADVGEIIPEHLATLIRSVVHQFSDARDAIKRQALAAAARGEPRTSLTLRLPATAAQAGEAYLAGLEEADAYARAARLLTLETPPAHQLFRRWYVEAVVQQLRDLVAGHRPRAVVPFEQRMLGEIQRLATLQRVTDRAARLQRVTAALANARTPEDVATVVVSEGVAALEASGGSLVVPGPDGEHIAVPGAVGYGEELVDSLREERLDAPLPAATALRTGEAIWLESREERDRRFPGLRGFEATTVSMCAVPLAAAGRVLGSLRFSFATRRLFDDDERAFVLALAAQTAQTLLRTETYAAERKASLDLQRALLPADVAQVPGWEIAAFYSPAGEQEAGGDFYDVLPMADGRFIAVVGDVMGRGVEAAAAMAQVRTMMRAYAVDDPDPAMVFERVDTFFRVVELAQLVTALYFLIDPQTGDVAFANAGHLPPILVDANGGRIVTAASGTAFGVNGFQRHTEVVTLPRDCSLLAVTDGLVERRGEDIDVGIERVLAAAAGTDPQRGADRLMRSVLAASASGDQDDDVTVLVIRRL
jgi:serine phosphatase RsbU (regulator of sigma subunit)/anti-sigma regulatory factor (Ser/Thr protein kinase)